MIRYLFSVIDKYGNQLPKNLSMDPLTTNFVPCQTCKSNELIKPFNKRCHHRNDCKITSDGNHQTNCGCTNFTSPSLLNLLKDWRSSSSSLWKVWLQPWPRYKPPKPSYTQHWSISWKQFAKKTIFGGNETSWVVGWMDEECRYVCCKYLFWLKKICEVKLVDYVMQYVHVYLRLRLIKWDTVIAEQVRNAKKSCWYLM